MVLFFLTTGAGGSILLGGNKSTTKHVVSSLRPRVRNVSLTMCLAATSGCDKPRQHLAAFSESKASQTPSDAMMSLPPQVESCMHRFGQIWATWVLTGCKKRESNINDKCFTIHCRVRDCHLYLLHMWNRNNKFSYIRVSNWPWKAQTTWPNPQWPNLQPGRCENNVSNLSHEESTPKACAPHNIDIASQECILKQKDTKA